MGVVVRRHNSPTLLITYKSRTDFVWRSKGSCRDFLSWEFVVTFVCIVRDGRRRGIFLSVW